MDKTKLTRAIARKGLQFKKQSPHIFFAGGVAGVIGATVLACRATLKLEEVVDDHEDRVNDVKALGEVGTISGQAYQQMIGKEYLRSAGKIVKLYGPSVALGAISIGALTGSHIQLTRRNTALTVTLAAVSKAYDDYRLRVQQEIGEEREVALFRGAEDLEIEDEDGRKKLVTNVHPGTGLSPYARIFEESNVNWVPSAELNYNFLKGIENHLNDVLHAKGHVMLNDVFDALSMERSTQGAVVGWIDNNPEGDGYISFGLDKPMAYSFVDGREENVWLDFNVDGVVFELIGKGN